MSDLQQHQYDEAYALWLLAGWNESYGVSRREFERSWRGSPVKKCIVRGGRVVAIGRANSDGVVYAMIHDIVVHPEHRGHGHGKRIVEEIVEALKAMGMRSVQLMAAKEQADFYRKLGFEARPTDAPGMQLSAKHLARR